MASMSAATELGGQRWTRANPEILVLRQDHESYHVAPREQVGSRCNARADLRQPGVSVKMKCFANYQKEGKPYFDGLCKPHVIAIPPTRKPLSLLTVIVAMCVTRCCLHQSPALVHGTALAWQLARPTRLENFWTMAVMKPGR